MASWVRRVRSDGGESIQIKWRLDGRWQCETFTDVRLAAEFRTAVEVPGHRWPEGWIKGEGWEVPEPVPAVVTLDEVAAGSEGYFAQQAKRLLRGKVKPYTVHRNKRIYELHLQDAFGGMPFTAVDEDAISDWIDEQLEAGAAPKSIRHRHGLLFSIMKHGQMRGKLRPDNPCALTELPELDAGTSQARQIRFF